MKFNNRGYNRKQIEKIGKEVGETSREDIRSKKKRKNPLMILYIYIHLR